MSTDMADMKITEAQLMRACSPLYIPVALESFSTLLLFGLFMYLFLCITSKGIVKAPGRAFFRLVSYEVRCWFAEVYENASTWSLMSEAPLKTRFRFCRKMNTAICQFSAAASLLAVTRWLHINNVNGFRYLGYCLTCPPMQAELILLIAPVVPCYRLVVPLSAFLTFTMLACGYASSLLDGDIFEGELQSQLLRGEGWGSISWSSFTTKACLAMPAVVILMFLSFVQIPTLGLLYVCKRNVVELPPDYLRLLAITSVTWLLFPVWWSLSYEGFAIITDTKLNGLGFVLLNFISKGSFCFQLLSMVRQFKAGKGKSEGQNVHSGEVNSRMQDRINALVAQDSGGAQPGYVKRLVKYDGSSLVVSGAVAEACRGGAVASGCSERNEASMMDVGQDLEASNVRVIRFTSPADSYDSEGEDLAPKESTITKQSKRSELLHDLGLAPLCSRTRIVTRSCTGEAWDLEDVPDEVLFEVVQRRLKRAEDVMFKVNSSRGDNRSQCDEIVRMDSEDTSPPPEESEHTNDFMI